MSWFLAFAGFAVADHPARVRATSSPRRRSGCGSSASSSSSRRSSWSFKRGETEYGIGAIPLGGFVKITGMNPEEELDARGRAPRLLQPAGLEADRRDRRPGRPSTSLIAFVILFVARLRRSTKPTQLAVGDDRAGHARRSGTSQAGDRIVSINGVTRGDGDLERAVRPARDALDDATTAPASRDRRLPGDRRRCRSSSSATARRGRSRCTPVLRRRRGALPVRLQLRRRRPRARRPVGRRLGRLRRRPDVGR